MFGVIDTVLIRYNDGYVAVPETMGGRERYIEVRGIGRDEAIALGESLLEAYSGSRSTTAVTGHVHNSSQQPGSFPPGTKMDGQMVQSINITMDQGGYATVTPELGNPLRDRLAEMDRRIARAATPVQSEWASPYPTPKTVEPIDTTVPTFSYSPQASYGEA